jgi:putative ABC transport system permease protein
MNGLYITALEIGLIYAPVIIGVFLTFRVLDFPDLTIEGSFVTGAAVSAIAVSHGVNGLIALAIGFFAGFIAGGITAFLHTVLGISKILSGILTLSMLFSINLHIMNGPNVSLLNKSSLITVFKTPLNQLYVLCFLFAIVVFVKFAVEWFLKTEFGLALRATGYSEATAKTFGIDVNRTKRFGIMLSNGLAGLSGALLAQYQGFADISMGGGTLVLVLAALMLGEVIIINDKLSTALTALIAGSIMYQLVINIALWLGLNSQDLKFITAAIVILIIVLSNYRKKALIR